MKHIIEFSQYLKEEEYIKEELVSDPANLRRELIKLVGDGIVDAVDKFMDENNVDVNYDSGTLLTLASKLGKLDLIKYFDEIGANFSIRRNLSLKLSLVYGKLDVSEYLLDVLSLEEEQLADVKEYVSSSQIASATEKKNALQLLSKY